MERKFDAIILGGGAAGLFCAIESAKRGIQCIVLEHNSSIGAKIRISGGGRCNFTNRVVTADDFVSQNPHFCKSAISRFTPNEIIALVESYGIEYYEKTKGQLFCRRSSVEFIEMLLSECRLYDVHILTDCEYRSIDFDTSKKLFYVNTSQREIVGSSFVVATGGISIAKLGASPIGYRIAEQFGHQIVTPQPALVPLVWNTNEKQIFSSLSGISFDAKVTCGNRSVRDSILLTHKGLSGPAILQTSLYWNDGDPIEIDLFPNVDVTELFSLLRNGSKPISTILSQYIPKRFADTLCELFGIHRGQQLSNDELRKFCTTLKCWVVHPVGTEGFEKAEVTRGGVGTQHISSRTMQSALQPNLYFIGEVLDVTGRLGGYNFQWAWSSAFAAATAIAERQNTI
jgi:predicted Rossmann fold flavoprotein